MTARPKSPAPAKRAAAKRAKPTPAPAPSKPADGKWRTGQPAGRPSKLTPDMHDALVAHIRAGATMTDAAAVERVARETVYDWIARGAIEPDTPFERFRHAVKAAEADAKLESLKLIRAHGLATWQAAAWYLERKYPHEFGQKNRGDVLPDPAGELAALLGLSREQVLGALGAPQAGDEGAAPPA